MENKKTYQLLNITLLESNFFRVNSNNFPEEITNDINIEVIHTIEENLIYVTLKVVATGTFNKEKAYEFITSYIGEFEQGDPSELPIEIFSRINAPAIIFPFVREHIASISLKAGLSAILLPPINFVKMHKEKVEQQKQML